MILEKIDICADSAFILRIIIKVIKIVRWVIPILLILLITFDLFKVVTSNPDDKAKKEALDKIVKRLVYSVIIFLVPTIINFVFTSIDGMISKDKDSNATPTTWFGCWNKVYNNPSYGTKYVKATPAPTTNNGSSYQPGNSNQGGSQNKSHVYTCTFHANTDGCSGRTVFASKEDAEQILSASSGTTWKSNLVCVSCGNNCYQMYYCVLN